MTCDIYIWLLCVLSYTCFMNWQHVLNKCVYYLREPWLGSYFLREPWMGPYFLREPWTVPPLYDPHYSSLSVQCKDYNVIVYQVSIHATQHFIDFTGAIIRTIIMHRRHLDNVTKNLINHMYTDVQLLSRSSTARVQHELQNERIAK